MSKKNANPPTVKAPTASATAAGSPPEKATFLQEGEYWTLGYAGKIFRLKDSKGLAYIAQLLRYPGTEFRSLDLARSGTTSIDSDEIELDAHEFENAGIHVGTLSDAGEVLDDQAKATYKRRLKELREEQAQARSLGRIERAENAEREMDALVAELSRATGLGGRGRLAVSPSERARQSVTRRIKNALSRIADQDFFLGQMLARRIRTGTYCSYNPDPNSIVDWELEASVADQGLSLLQQGLTERALNAQDLANEGAFAEPRLLPAGLTEFVGRRREIEVLGDLLNQAHSGKGTVAMVGGGPGVGKTRLTTEVALYATKKGFRCVKGQCYESDERSPYLPFAEILELMLVRSPNPEDSRCEISDVGAELAQITPSLRRIFPDLPPLPELPAPQLPRFIFQGVAEFLRRASRRSPLLLLFDDLQWADQSTLSLFDFMAYECRAMRIVILGIYRDTEPGSNPGLVRTLERLIRDGMHPIKLAGLSRADVAEMIRSLSKREPPLQLVRLTFEETEGNPFFVEELYKHLAEEGKIFDSSGQFRAGLMLNEADVPENVRLVLGRRLGRLSEQAKRVLTAAAVIGRSFSFELLQAALDSFEVSDLLAAVDQAQRMGLIVNSEGAESALNFCHELVRQTLLTEISKPRRQRLHLAVAEAIEQLDVCRLKEHAAALAHHLRNAGGLADVAKTAGYFWLAGTNALEGAAYEEAYRNFQTAASYKGADLRWRAECLQGMEIANRGLGHWEDALRMCNEAIEIYRKLGDIEMATDGIRESIGGLLLTGRYQEAIEMARRELAVLGDEPSERRADLLAVLGLSNGVAGAYVAAKDFLNEAATIARRFSNRKLLARVLTELSVVNDIFVEVADSLVNTQTSLDLTQSDEFPRQRALALSVQMMALLRLGRMEEATRVAAELEPLARKIGYLSWVETCIWTKGWTEFGKAPDLMRLEAQFTASVEICRTAGRPGNLANSITQVSLVKFLRGQQPSALDSALEACQLEVPGYMEGCAVGTVFRERAYAGDHAGAVALLNERRTKLPVAGQPNTIGSWALLISVIEGLAVLGERNRVAEFYPLACDLIDTGMICFPTMARFPQTIAGVAATAARQWQSAEEHFRIALQQAEEIPDQLEHAECSRFFGAMLLDRNAAGDRVEAQRMLTEALDAYSRIGMPCHVDLTTSLLAKL